ncbi:BlaI/MecI/CopY family transcriptional regulator [Microvenator marinus]|uniref:BlaI/MecI/CopY family transcriptional regulator n=1 Tax=Microvenator marinus TaxID=2600177 RepID=A0A5B8XVB2_9DELT|nr:BlaI/MecI/CopY family transcriptional regulator [Microvenator marinus]QED28023.1 BlaI/MecI/CopY family transcriptional regulator [Microvenator marinus]
MKGIRIRPEQDGLRTTLFELEAEIMEAVWERGWADFSVSDVHQLLEKRREIAYTTVMTTVSRLFDKGLLTRHKDGRRFIYQPAMSNGEFIEAMTREVMESLPPVGREAAVALLVERVAEADEGELDFLEEMIRRKRRGDG